MENGIEFKKIQIESLHQISNILSTGLSRETIGILAELIESGVHPEALTDGTLSIYLLKKISSLYSSH